MATIKARLSKLEAPARASQATPPIGLSPGELYAWTMKQPAPAPTKKTSCVPLPPTKEEAEAIYWQIMGPDAATSTQSKESNND